MAQDCEEMEYCIELLNTRGNRNVPRDAIASYLQVQAAGARRAGQMADAQAYREAEACVNVRDFSGAMAVLGARLGA